MKKKLYCIFCLCSFISIMLCACGKNKNLIDMGTVESDQYMAIVWEDRTYIPFCVVSKKDCGTQTGYLNGETDHRVCKYKDYPTDEWLASYLTVDGGAMLFKEVNVANIPDGLESEYELKIPKSKEQIVAEINGIPVSAFEVGLKRYLNDDPLDDMAILNEIAKERFLLEKAKAAGINISYDDIMKEIREEEEYVENEAARGNELMIQRQKEDEELLTALGMTKDEFNKEIYADILLYNKTFIEYGKYYYTSNPNYIMTFEEYIDQEFDKADIKIARYHNSKN